MHVQKHIRQIIIDVLTFSFKRFSLCNFTYLICACPPIWIIELHHMDQVNNASALLELITTKNHTPVITTPSWINKVPPLMTRENESMMIMGTEIEEFMHSAYLTTTDQPQNIRRITRDTFIHEVLSNETVGLQVSMDVLQSLQLHNFSLKERIRILEQLLLLSVIVGRWLMPREGLTRDQLSQLLLINIGTAADILELFEAFNEQEVRRNDFLRTVILSLWQASLLQFCFNKTALKKPTNYNNNLPLFKTYELSSFQCSSDEKSLSNAEIGSTVKNNNDNNSNANNTELNVKDKLPRRGTLASLRQWYSKRKQENTDRDDCDIINAECGSSLKTSQSEMQQQQSQQQKFQQSPQLLLPPSTITSDIPKSISQNDFVNNYNDPCCPLMRGCLLLCHERPCLCCETELWAIGISLMLQDLPFLILRITLIVYYNVKSYSNVFFTCKNTLLILLQVFRSIVILSESSKF
ncbi:Transmembrane protein 26 [Schistosoma japonicum]|nr:Transmembrane protein 26 [Schistosoma japonicum]